MAKSNQAPFRLPLAVAVSNRSVDTLTSPGSSGIVGLGVVGSFIVGSTASSSKDQRLVNAFPNQTANSITGQTIVEVIKRPGWAVNATPSAGNIGTAVHVWAGSSNEVISAFGGTNSTIFKDTTNIGTLTGLATHISDTLIGTTANVLIVTDANKGYFYPSGGAMTNINDADFPGNAGETVTGGFASMNGYNYIMTLSGKIYNSDLNSISAWTSTSFLSANMEPDGGVGVLRYKNTIMAFGKESIEFYQDVGNATGSPLQRVDQGFIKLGVVNQYCYKALDDTVAWLGTSANSTVSLYMLDGYSPKRVSTTAIDSILSKTAVTSLFLNVARLVGKTLIFVVSTSDQRTLVYCVEDDMWHEWSSATILWHSMHGTGSGNRIIYAVSRVATGGKVYLINPQSFVFQDDSISYTVQIQTFRLDGGTVRKKFLNRVRLIGDIQTSSTPVDIQWTDDDYATYSTARTVNMTSSDPNITCCGSFKRRAFLLTNTSNTPMRLEALELELDQGGYSI